MYVVTGGDEFRCQVSSIEVAAAELTRRLERAADHGRPLAWTVTTPDGHEISGPTDSHTSDVSAAIEQAYALLVRHHLTST